MKNLFFMILLVSLFNSCSKQEMKIDIHAQAELMKQEPVSVDFFQSTSNLMRFITEEDEISRDKYREILIEYDYKFCEINDVAFEGDIMMMEYAKIMCNLRRASVAFKDKYSYLDEMEENEKRNLFALLNISPQYDKKKILEKGRRLLFL